MKQWIGDVHEVYSRVCIRSNEGLKRKLIGTYHVCTEKEVMEAFDSHEIAASIDVLVNQVSCVNINVQCQQGPHAFSFTPGKTVPKEPYWWWILSVLSIRSPVAIKLNENNKHLLNKIMSDEVSNFLSTRFIF